MVQMTSNWNGSSLHGYKVICKEKNQKIILFQNFIFQGGVDKQKRKFGTFGAHNFIMAAIFEIIFSPTSCY